MTIKTRLLAASDLKHLRDILVATDLFPADMLDDMVADYLAHNSSETWLVAEQSGTVAAFAYAAPERMTNGTYNILAVATHPDHQRNGIASSLIGAMEQVLRCADGRIAMIETIDNDDFAPQRRLYTALGYVRTGHIPDFYDTGFGKVTFAKQL